MHCGRLTVDPEHRLELVLLKQDLVHGLLDGGEVVQGLADDHAGVRKIHLGEDPPDQLLQSPSQRPASRLAFRVFSRRFYPKRLTISQFVSKVKVNPEQLSHESTCKPITLLQPPHLSPYRTQRQLGSVGGEVGRLQKAAHRGAGSLGCRCSPSSAPSQTGGPTPSAVHPS